MDFYSGHLFIPRGIAKTQALMENLFCTIVCCCTSTPLIIVGAPGSSKTLSFNLALSNIKGGESKSYVATFVLALCVYSVYGGDSRLDVVCF